MRQARTTVAEQGFAEKEAITEGMEERGKQFFEKGTEVTRLLI